MHSYPWRGSIVVEKLFDWYSTLLFTTVERKKSLRPFRKLQEHDTSSRPSPALTVFPISCRFQVRVEAFTSFSILNLDFDVFLITPKRAP